MFTLFVHQSNGTSNFVDNVEVKSGRFQGTQSWESMEIETDLKMTSIRTQNFYSRLHKILNSLHLTYYALYLFISCLTEEKNEKTVKNRDELISTKFQIDMQILTK